MGRPRVFFEGAQTPAPGAGRYVLGIGVTRPGLQEIPLATIRCGSGYEGGEG